MAEIAALNVLLGIAGEPMLTPVPWNVNKKIFSTKKLFNEFIRKVLESFQFSSQSSLLSFAGGKSSFQISRSTSQHLNFRSSRRVNFLNFIERSTNNFNKDVVQLLLPTEGHRDPRRLRTRRAVLWTKLAASDAVPVLEQPTTHLLHQHRRSEAQLELEAPHAEHPRHLLSRNEGQVWKSLLLSCANGNNWIKISKHRKTFPFPLLQNATCFHFSARALHSSEKWTKKIQKSSNYYLENFFYSTRLRSTLWQMAGAQWLWKKFISADSIVWIWSVKHESSLLIDGMRLTSSWVKRSPRPLQQWQLAYVSSFFHRCKRRLCMSRRISLYVRLVSLSIHWLLYQSTPMRILLSKSELQAKKH